MNNKAAIKYGFLAPSVLLLLAVIAYPIGHAVYLALHDITFFNINAANKPFVGLANFKEIFQNEMFLNALFNTLKLVGIALAAELILGLALALLFNYRFRGRGILVTLMLVSTILSPIVIALMWRYMLNFETGIINHVLSGIGLQRVAWLADPTLAFISAVISEVWWTTPFVFVVVLAGLQSIPVEVNEAALVDGCTTWQTFIHVTLPLLRPIIRVVILIRGADLIKTFDVIYGLTNGGPGNATEVLPVWLFKRGFTDFDLSTTATGSLVLLGITLLLAIGFLRKTREQE